MRSFFLILFIFLLIPFYFFIDPFIFFFDPYPPGGAWNLKPKGPKP